LPLLARARAATISEWAASTGSRVPSTPCSPFLYRTQPQLQCHSRGNIPNFEGVNGNEETDMVTANDTYTFSPTLLNQTVISYLRTTSAVLNTKTFPPSDYGIDLPQ